MKAKQISFFAIIFATVWVAGLTLLKAFLPLTTGKDIGLNFFEIIVSGLFFIIAFIPIFVSIWLDKKNEGDIKTTDFISGMFKTLSELLEKQNNTKIFNNSSSPNDEQNGIAGVADLGFLFK